MPHCDYSIWLPCPTHGTKEVASSHLLKRTPCLRITHLATDRPVVSTRLVVKPSFVLLAQACLSYWYASGTPVARISHSVMFLPPHLNICPYSEGISSCHWFACIPSIALFPTSFNIGRPVSSVAAVK